MTAKHISGIRKGGAELDLLVFVNGKRLGFEFKYADAPAVTRSLQVAHGDLRLEQVLIVHPGSKSYPLNPWADAVAVRDVKVRLQDLT